MASEYQLANGLEVEKYAEHGGEQNSQRVVATDVDEQGEDRIAENSIYNADQNVAEKRALHH